MAAAGQVRGAEARMARGAVLGRRAAGLASAVLIGGCFAAVAPRAGRPVELRAGQALVFGRIRVHCPAYARDLPVFSRDPADHVIPPDPALELQLRALRPPGGAVRYATAPSPEVHGDGTFEWILARGDYQLLANPRPFGSPRFDDGETVALGRFTVPPGAGSIYLGTLVVELAIPQQALVEAARGRETPYSVERLAVVDEQEAVLAAVLARYPSIPEPRAVAPMVPAAP
jgi:hypothetical protein